MAVNNAGALLDTAGEIAIDFVWGNMPPQPNDARTTRLDLTLGDHINLESGWGGYPQFTANTAGSDVAGSTDYVQVPNVIGMTTADADDVMKDSGLTVTTATAAVNARTNITAFNATSTTAATITATSANTNYPVGTKVTIVAGTPAAEAPVNLPAYAIGTFTVTAVASNQITVSGTGFTVANTTGVNATATLGGTAGTIKSQSIAAGAATTAVAAAVTITPYATAS
jgi:hypothetical protein